MRACALTRPVVRVLHLRRTGVRTAIGAYDKRLNQPPMKFDERPLGADYGALADKSKIAAMKQLMRKMAASRAGSPAAAGQAATGSKASQQLLSSKDVVPAVVELAREQTSLLGLAKKIESVADNRKVAAVKEDQLVHATLSRLLGSAAPSAAPAAVHGWPQVALLVPPLGKGAQREEKQKVLAQAMARARQPGSQKALQDAAMKMGRSFLSFLPPKMAEEDVDLFASKTDPALEPILQAAGAHPSPFAVPGSGGAAQPEKPVLGNTLAALNGRVAQLEGSLEQSLGLLNPNDQSQIVAKLSKLMGQSTAQAQAPAAVLPDDAAASAKGASSWSGVRGMQGPTAAAVDAELRRARGRSARAALSADAAKWIKSQEASATAAADTRVLSHLKAHDKAEAAADKTMSEEAARSRGAGALSQEAQKTAAVAARLRAIAAADAEKARELESQLQQGQAAALGADALHNLGTLRKLEQTQRLNVAKIGKEQRLGAVVPPFTASGAAVAQSNAAGGASGGVGAGALEPAAEGLEAHGATLVARCCLCLCLCLCL